jgi:transcriptional regulator with XRE-family HTH domain
MSASYISLIERGERDPALSVLERIAGALGIPLSILLFIASDPSEMGDLPREAHDSLFAAAMKLVMASSDDGKHPAV